MVIYKLQNIQNQIQSAFRSHSFCGIYEEMIEVSSERR